MAQELVLHLGASKTGSSAIQAFLRRNSAALAERGLRVPSRELDWEGQVTGEHVWGVQRFIGAADEEGLMQRLGRLRDGLAEGQRAVLSAENLSNLGAHRLFGRVAQEGPTRAILYIRRQDELLTSAWQQWHCKIEPDLHAWLYRGLRQFGLWDRLILDWESVLGSGAVEVRIFERDALHEGDVVRDFAAAMSLPGGDGLEFASGDVNPSLSDVVTDLVSGDRALFRDVHDNDYFNWVQAKVGSTWGASAQGRRKVSLISREQRDSLLSFYRDMNERVRARFFPERATLFAPVDHSRYEYLDREALRDRQLRFLNDLIYASRDGQRSPR